MTVLIRALGLWSSPRWGIALVSGTAYLLAVAIPTDLVGTPVFSREIPPTWWAWPALVLSSTLAGLLTATYVAAATPSAMPGTEKTDPSERAARGGFAGGLLTFFAVGCPVCNKLVLLALGYAGAITWFEPFQPVLQAVGIALLAWALRERLRGSVVCPVPSPASTPRT